MDVFKRYYSSLVDLEQASESVKPVTGTCLQKRRNQYIIAAMHIILLLFLLFVLALCLCMLFNMHSEFSRLKERVDVLEMSRFVDPRSGVDEFTSLRHQVNPGLKKKVTSVDSPNYFDDVDKDVVVSIVPSTEKYPRDKVDDSKFTDRTRHNKIDFQSEDVDILSNDNTEIENIEGDSVSDNDDWERYEKEIIEEEAEEEDGLDKEIAEVDKYGDIVLSPESKSSDADSDGQVLKNRKRREATDDRSYPVRNRRNTGVNSRTRTTTDNVRKSKPDQRNPRRHSAAIHLNSNVRDTASVEQLIKLGSGELERISLDHGTLTRLGYQPLRGDCNGQECYIYKAWTPSNWTSRGDFEFSRSSGRVNVKKRGLYYIYAQILYHNPATRNSYDVMINDVPFIKCMTSVDYVSQNTTVEGNAKYKNCYTGGVTMLNQHQEIYIKDGYGHVTNPVANFFGIIKISEA